MDLDLDLLPQDLDAERYVLGHILVTDDSFPQVRTVLNPGDFSVEKNKRIFAQMIELYERGEPIDRATIANALDSKGLLSSCDGRSYLVSLDDGMPTLANVEQYCRIVRDKAVRRAAVHLATGLVQRIMSGDDTPELLAESEALRSLFGKDRAKSKLQGIADVIEEAGGVNPFFSSQLSSSITTPFAAINHSIVGLQPEQLVIVAARPAVGKSSWSSQLAVHAAFRRKRTLVYSMEMSSRSLLRRAIIAQAGVSGQKVRFGKTSVEEYRRLSDTLDEFSQLDAQKYLLFSEEAHVTSLSITTDLQRMQAIGKPAELVIVDYLQLMGAIGRYDNKVQEVTAISRGLKLLAKEFKIPVVALSQLSRAVEQRGDGRPVLSDLRESGSIEQDADLVMFLYRDPKDLNDKDADGNEKEIRLVNWEVAKQREGPTNSGVLHFRKKMARFEEGVGYEEEAA